jgi:hypothetical protein
MEKITRIINCLDEDLMTFFFWSNNGQKKRLFLLNLQKKVFINIIYLLVNEV